MRHANYHQGYSNNGKPFSSRFSPSEGIEDIANLGLNPKQGSARGSRRVPTSSRISYKKDQVRSQAIGDRSVECFEVPPAFQAVGAEEIVGAQARNQSLADSVPVLKSFSNPPFPESETPLIQDQEDPASNVINKESMEVDAGNKKKGEKRKNERPIGSQKIEGNLVLGMDVMIEESLEVAECTLVDRARGKKFTSCFIQAWGEQNFLSNQIKGFEDSNLANGWFMFRFENKEAAGWVLERNWAIGNIPVLLKKWNPLFDAIHEKTDVFPVWVKAPGLPSFSMG